MASPSSYRRPPPRRDPRRTSVDTKLKTVVNSGSNHVQVGNGTSSLSLERKTEIREDILHGVRLMRTVNIQKESLENFIKLAFDKKFGPVIKSYFPIDRRTGHFVGHGEVYFENEEKAREAADHPLTLNGIEIKLEYISRARVTPLLSVQNIQIQTPIQKSEPFDNLYVKNIADCFKNEDDFVKVFETFGPISSHKIEKNSDGSWVGFGFVRFESSDDARRAVESLHNHSLPNGRRLHVSKYESKNSRSKSESTGFAASPSYETLSLSSGKLIDLIQQRRKQTSIPGRAKVYSPAFEHSRRQETLNLTTASNGNGIQRQEDGDWEGANEEQRSSPPKARSIQPAQELEDSGDESSSSHANSVQVQQLKPEKIYYNSQVKQPQNLYVKNFSGLLKTDDDLLGAFKIFGHILSVKIRGPNFGYVCFKNPQQAQAAIDALNGKAIGNGKKLHVAKELSKEERQKTKDRHQEQRGDCEPEYLCAGSAITIPKGDAPCTICSKSKQKPLVILECQHLYCKPCLTEWLTVCIDVEDLDAMHCQHEDCEEQFSMNLVKVLVAKKDFIKYDALLLYNLLETMDDIVMCPKCGCPSSIDLDCPRALVSCKKCSWSFLPEVDDDSE